jgi:intein-encoded DNA endonuclease-like protein
MDSDYLVEERKSSYRLRVSNSIILNDIKKLGIVPNKSKILLYPDVTSEYLSHFLRGFVDGDGWVVTRVRKCGGREICVGFCNGSLKFMRGVADSIRNRLQINNFNLRKRVKTKKNGEDSLWYQLEFYSENANKILSFLHDSLDKKDLFLKRKYDKFLEARDFFVEEEDSKFLGRKGV